MKRWTAFLGTFILSYLFWILFLMQDFNILKLGAQEIIVGAIVAAIVSLFSSQYFAREDGMWLFKKFRIINLIAFIPVYLWELIKANFSVAIKSLSPKIDINPGIVKITTDLNSDYGLAMLSNCITLTPGTITMDIYEDEDNKNAMYIHWIDATTEDTKEASEIMNINSIFYIVAILLAILALVLVYRVFKGPNVIDRVLAADSIDIILGIVMILFGAIEERAMYLDLGLIITLLGFIGTVLISKYIEGEL